MAKETLVICPSSEDVEKHKGLLEKLEDRLETRGIAEWAGTMTTATMTMMMATCGDSNGWSENHSPTTPRHWQVSCAKYWWMQPE